MAQESVYRYDKDPTHGEHYKLCSPQERNLPQIQFWSLSETIKAWRILDTYANKGKTTVLSSQKTIKETKVRRG